jgi:hypothetical protein
VQEALVSLLVPNVVGVRHLSPAGATHLRTVLERVRPTCVLVEAPSGIEPEMRHLVHPETTPPVAILAFTRSKPLRTLVYPLASYSPEWVACRWALTEEAELSFIDLPAPTFLALQGDEDETGDETASPPASERDRRDVLTRVAEAAGAPDLETWWERAFEHTTDSAAYLRAAFALGEGMRELRQDEPAEAARNELRESFMRRQIRRAIGRGHAPERCVVVCGAYHAPVLTEEAHAMSDEEEGALPALDAVITLMPYSHQRLHARSGYGAGNHAPLYYQMLFEELAAGHPERLAARYLARVARRARRAGLPRSSAQIIDAVRLAAALAAASDSPAIALCDLHDAAVTCLGAGERAPLAEALDEVDTGHAIGTLPKGVSRTALQDDFRDQVRALKLDKYLCDADEELELDLRENRFVKGESAAFLDRNRSVFFHRLHSCELPLAKVKPAPRATGTSWKERWVLRWSPEHEVRLAELSLLGDSIGDVVSLLLSERLAACQDAGSAAEVLERAATCRLADALENARRCVQAAAVEDDSLPSLASATASLLAVTRFGGIRAVDPAPLWPLAEQIFLRAALLLPRAIVCNDAARPAIAKALLTLAQASVEEPSRLAVEHLEASLRTVALSDVGNPHLAGLASSVLIERMQLGDDELAASIGRRLSPGEDVDLAAGFFEGLTSYNRMGLFSRPAVWGTLSRFVDALDGPGYLRALVPLRRAFASFEPGEVRRVVSALAAVWDDHEAAPLAAALETGLSVEEAAALNAQLGDLDLDL